MCGKQIIAVNIISVTSFIIDEFDLDRSRNLEQLGFPDDSVSIQEALKLIEDIELPEKTVFVIDDYRLDALITISTPT
jgi:hypothetical protein